MKYGLYGAVLASLVGGAIAWVNVDKSVTLRVDGTTRVVRTTAATVQGTLASAGYPIGAHDVVAPAPATRVHNGSVVVLKRGRELLLTVDGVPRDVWVTAPTVADALDELGYGDQAHSSVSRAKRLPLDPTSIDLRTPKPVTVRHDGQTDPVVSTDATVGDLLAALRITVGAEDSVTPAPSTPLRAGEQIVVGRVTHRVVTERRVIPFATTRQKDRSLDIGQSAVAVAGKNGLTVVKYDVTYTDGKVTAKTVLSAKTTPPVTRVVRVGTRPASTPEAAQAIAKRMAAKRGWGTDQFACLVPLWGHESGWRVSAANPSGAYGIPQALPGDKMASAGPNWQTDPATQIAWGLDYIAGHYGTPCGAWDYWQAHGWY
ncbi:MAG: ubiquitin-like domain-containing protein [Actinomycetia bacterium]|nr:ubiquitin-like domain-containing protein [Actinomycetes bacterium]